MIRMLVCGGRRYANRAWLYQVLDSFKDVEVVMTGAAKGADQLARDWANDRGHFYLPYPANWEKYGKKAGVIRNLAMLKHGQPNVVVAFPGGKGTAHMVAIATAARVAVVHA